jgi:hypothetical protein
MDGGTNLFTPDERERNRLANSRRILERYASRAEEIDVLVKRANASLRGRARDVR